MNLRPGATERALRRDWWSLTPRELDILRCAADGLDSQGTGQRLFIAPQTVKSHRTGLFLKLGVSNIAHAVSIGYRTGLLTVTDEDRVIQQAQIHVTVNGIPYSPTEGAA